MNRHIVWTRRQFLKAGGIAAAAAALAACNPLVPVQTAATGTPAPEATTPGATRKPAPAQPDAQLARLVRRITFGVQPADLARAQAIGFDAFIDEQLAPDTILDADVQSRLGSLTTLSMSPAQLIQVNPPQQPARELMQATALRALYSRRQLYELLVDFWSNHFNIYLGGGAQAYLKTVDDRDAIRPHVLGNFRDLLSASAHSPAMLVYLNNAVSTKNLPNENYGRELLELHTLSVSGGYTQTDVHEAARALTGWTVRGKDAAADAGTFYFNPGTHDDGAKLILGQAFPAGQGIRDGEQLLDLLAQHPATAHFISLKLARHFVADDPPAALVEHLAAAFSESGGDLARVMSALLHSDEFRVSLGQKLKRPFEFVVSALRATQASAQAGDPTLGALRLMGQPLFGWQTPDGFPDAAGAWATTTGMLGRWNFALALASNSLKDSPVDLASVAGAVATVDDAIDALSRAFLGEPLPGPAAQILRDAAGKADLHPALPALAALILASPYFQYR
jgi:uncharacterized protein (DUF1800 family)